MADVVRDLMGISPDCRSGKHASCDGGAWDADRDEAVGCACRCHRATSAPTSPTTEETR